MRPIYS